MREILSKHDLRQLELIEFLVKNKDHWTSLKGVSEYLKTPLRTIHYDIKEINDFIEPAIIESSSVGIKIVIPKNYSERYFIKKVLEKSFEFNFIEFILLNEGKTIWGLAEKFHLSESTIKRTIKRINTIFGREGLSIKTNSVSIVGDERKVIQFMSFYFYEKYFLLEEYMTVKQINLIEKLIKEILREVGKEITFPTFKRIATRIYISCIRLRNNHDITVIPKAHFQGHILKDLDFCQQFEEAFGLELTGVFIQKLFHVFSSQNYIFNNEDLKELISKKPQQKILYFEIKKVLKNISCEFDIFLDKKIEDKLLLDLMNIINLKNIKGDCLFILYNQRERFLSKLSSNYLHVSEMIKTQLKENISLSFTEMEWNELNYILLTHWTYLYDKFRFIEDPIKVLLVNDTDIEHGYFIKRELETYSRHNIEVEVIKDYSMNQLPFLPEDNVLITNIPGIKNIRCPMLCIEEFMGSDDWKNLDNILEEIISFRRHSL